MAEKWENGPIFHFSAIFHPFSGGAKIHFSAIFPFRAGGPIWGLYWAIGIANVVNLWGPDSTNFSELCELLFQPRRAASLAIRSPPRQGLKHIVSHTMGGEKN